jgi:hypothetical protein
LDDFAFDLGYFQSQSIVLFSLGLIFSGVMPPVSFFLMIFFFFRYYIDKYNLIFVYSRDFEGGGIIVKKQVLPLLLLALYLFQVLNCIYFAVFSRNYLKGGLIFICVQTLTLLSIRTYNSYRAREDNMDLIRTE